MSEPFGKRNRRIVTKPPFAKPRTHKAPPKSRVDNKVYVYVAGAILFAILAGYALAA
jgi:hypothetical protein